MRYTYRPEEFVLFIRHTVIDNLHYATSDTLHEINLDGFFSKLLRQENEQVNLCIFRIFQILYQLICCIVS